MRWLRAWLLRLGGLFCQERRDRELVQELECHLQMHIDDNLRSGMNPDEARRIALITLGGMEATKEYYRDRRGIPALDGLIKDFRYGLRMLHKNPGFAAAGVLTLALGIGANTAVFSLVNGVYLRPLPYRDAERLVMLWSTRITDGWQGQPSPLDFVSWRSEKSAFESLGAVRLGACNLTGDGEPISVRHGHISPGFFEMLGVAPKLGRTFAPQEYRKGENPVVLLSHALWRQRFGADPGVVGQKVRLSDESFTVVGVMPNIRQYPIDDIGVWTPLELDEARPDDRHFLFVIGRLRPNETVSEAQAGICSIAARLARDYPESHAGHSVAVVPLRQSFVGPVRPALIVLCGAVGFVLLIACANVASLLLARSTARTGEFGVRLALGASRWRIIRQTLAESCLLALAGGVLGIFFAGWAETLLLGSIPAELSLPTFLKDVGIDYRVLGFTVGLSVLTGILFGILPALRSSGVILNSVLKEGGRTATAGRGQNRLRGLLVAVELALTLVLLVAAGLLMKNIVRLQHTDPGLKPGSVLVMEISLPPAKYNTPARIVAFYREVLARVRMLPAVREAGLVNNLPFRGWTTFNFTIEGRAVPAPEEVPEANEYVVSSQYFRTLGIGLQRGRNFEEHEDTDSRPAVIVNEALVQRYFPDEDPIGRHIRPGGPDSNAPWYAIIGVARNVRNFGLDALPRPEVYYLCTQHPWLAMTLVVHTESEPLALTSLVKQQIWTVDPSQPLSGVASMTQVLADSLWPGRVMAYLQAIFAAAALLMAAIGLYGVISQTVSLRQHEFGLRMALGAQPNDILWLVLKQGLRLILIGVGLGLGSALALNRALLALLHDIDPIDPAVYAAVAGFLAAVALLACYLPARRATRGDPATTLRYE